MIYTPFNRQSPNGSQQVNYTEIEMKTFAIIVILIQMHFALSENPTCAFYDFNDPLILSEFDDCTLAGSHPLRTLSYSDSTFPPFREDSRFFLTTNKSVHSDNTQCISTKIPFRGNFSSFSFQIGINMRNNKDIDQYNDVQLFIEDVVSFQINANTNDWTLYKRDYTLPSLGTFDDAVVSDFALFTTNLQSILNVEKFVVDRP